MFDGDLRPNDLASNSAKATFGMYINDTHFGWLNDTLRISKSDLVERALEKQLRDGGSNGRDSSLNVSEVDEAAEDAEWASRAMHVGEILESGVPFCNAGMPLGDPETCQAGECYEMIVLTTIKYLYYQTYIYTSRGLSFYFDQC
jgi:hypothetical protein